MQNWQTTIVVLYLILNVVVFIKSYVECKYKKNAFGLTSMLQPLGVYVFGDGVIFGAFWSLASLVSLITQDFILFLLIISVFWLVRSVGETIYWLNEQFSGKSRNDPKKLPYYSIFQNESVWFVMQIQNQCVTVVTIITTVYLFHIWLR